MFGILADQAAETETMRREFAQMPGLCLTLAQGCRLWQLCLPECEAALEVLVEEGFLCRMPDGQYARADVGATILWDP